MVSKLQAFFSTVILVAACSSAYSQPAMPPLPDNLSKYGQVRERSLKTPLAYDDRYINVVDGFVVKENDKFPNIDIVNSVTADTARLNEIGARRADKPYLFLNSRVNLFRYFVYGKLKVNLNGINLPIILNGDLITPDRYYLLERVDTATIKTVTLTKNPPGFFDMQKMPLGVVLVTAN